MGASSLKGGRYEIREILGQGGMGVVYRCYDTVIRREVAVKTIRDIPDKLALDMFYKECNVLAGITHPNIVEIFDIGELEEAGGRKPYFVMPLLPGVPLDKLIRNSPGGLGLERVIDVVCQTCRGLQAAHERGLVHRDIKPSNIFVLNDDAVKIIDFGVAHMAGSGATSLRGTLLYMAPEQVQLQPPSAPSDLFSLGVVAYEALTGRLPFQAASQQEVANAIVHLIAPPVSDLNPAVNQNVSRVIHKAMAKQPWHRFGSARDLGEALQKALRNEPLELFDPARVRPRMERAGRAYEQGDWQFASEILGELEAEGYLDAAITQLRRRIDAAVRQKTVAQLLESARTRLEEQEYPLALHKVQEALRLDPQNAEALGLRKRIEETRGERQVDEWLRLAQQHIESGGFSHARLALQNVLQVNATNARAVEMLDQLSRREREMAAVRHEKRQHYEAALAAYERADLSSALSRLEKVLDLDRRAPETSPSGATGFQQFYNRVRGERDAMVNGYAEAKSQLDAGEFSKARALCEEYLRKYPGQALFQALQVDIEARRRQKLSSFIAEVDRRAEAEPDLDRRVTILQDAAARLPEEEHFRKALQLAIEKRDLVRSIEAKGRGLENQGQFAEALAQWEILRTIYPQYPGLEFEMERVTKRRDQHAQSSVKSQCISQVDACLARGDHQRALTLIREGLAQYPADAELTALEELARQGVERRTESQKLAEQGQAACAAGQVEEGMAALEKALATDPSNVVARAWIADVAVKQARATLATDWRRAAEWIERALAADPESAAARSVGALVEDRSREEFIEQCAAEARRLQAAGDIGGALAVVEDGLRECAAPRLEQLRALLKNAAGETAPPVAMGTAAASGALTAALPQPTAVSSTPPPPAARMQAVSAPPAAGPKPTGTPSRPFPWKATVIAGGSALAVLALVAAGVKLMPRHDQGVAHAVLEIKTVPAGATILVDGQPKGSSNSKLQLPVGSHEIQATLAGYRPAVASLTLRESVPGVVDLQMEALPAVLRVFTNLEPAKVSIDDGPATEVQGGQLVLERLPEGSHTLSITSPQGEATVPLQIAPATLPKVAGPVTAKQIAAVVVSNLGAEARVYGSAASVKVAVDGQPAGEISADGLLLTKLAPGAHELGIGEAKGFQKIAVEAGPGPSLTAFFNTQGETGTLVVVTGEDGATVWVDGKKQRRATRGGQLRIPNLGPKQYVVRVAKEGFQDVAQQQVEIRKSEDSRLIFQLKPVPTQSAAVIEGALPGAEVKVDGTAAGVVGADGSFSIPNLRPGEHTLELRKEQHRPRIIMRAFPAGQTVRLGAAEVALEAIPKAPEPAPAAAKRAPTPAAAAPKAAQAVGMEGWADQSGWQSNNGWYARRGGEFVLFKRTPSGGTLVFTLTALRGKRLRWVVRFAGEKDHVLFEMDDKNFYRRQVVNGKSTEMVKKPHGLPKQPNLTCTISLKLGAGRVEQRVHNANDWAVLDDWNDPGGNFTQGQFGFYVHGKDEIGLSNFSFMPAQ